MDKLNKSLHRKIEYHALSVDEIFHILESSYQGISSDEAYERINHYGKNQLKKAKKKTIFKMFLDQFKSVMILILLIAAGISGFMNEFTDTLIILFVVILNAILGVAQEYKAEKSLEALKSLSKPFSNVKRDSRVKKIRSEEIVPGDIVFIEAGDYIPADMRLLESASLKIQEAALTGESVPVEKNADKIHEPDIVIGDRKNMVFMGSIVTYGRGIGIVTSTGMNTEVGKIAGYLTQQDTTETPLQKKLSEMGKYLSVAVVGIAIIIFIAGILQGKQYSDMFLIAISLAVAAIPEGLPAIVTIVLALGVQKMSKQNAIIRKLPAVETLGSTEIICSDKTGTLTQNKMTVKEIYIGNQIVKVENLTNKENDLEIFAQILTLCNDSRITRTSKNKIVSAGDPTETALVNFAADKGFFKDEIEKKLPRKTEIPFDSERKLMTTINQVSQALKVFTKGAPDILLNKCDKILINGSIQPLTTEMRQEVEKANTNMSSRALRVLALAYKDIENIPENVKPETIEKNLVFAGLVGMIDPPRDEVKDAVHVCNKAGIRPVMITGDHKETAAAIAKQLGIIETGNEVLTGSELDKISEKDFMSDIHKYSVYARVSPEHKVRIVTAWQQNSKVVAMTGDGVNDAPALKKSDIGIGMGITGTDVAKGVSDMVLADDNFATIVLAVKEGRKIFSNIRKCIQFLLSANMGEVLTLFIATMLNWDILFPIHILWINLVTDSFPALALGVEKAEKNIMEQKPQKSKGSIFSAGLGFNIVYQGALEGAITLATYYSGMMLYSNRSTANTMAFITLGLIQLIHSFNVRSASKSIFQIGIFTNIYLVFASILSSFLLIIVVIIPGLNTIFRVIKLNIEQWLIVIIASFLIVPIIEVVKSIQRKLLR